MTDSTQHRSLTAFLQQSKQRLFGNAPASSASTQQAPASPPHHSSSATQTPPDDGSQQCTKNQTRRAQVRSAQIRHRQRKADQQKQLERDVSRYRCLITRAQEDAETLRKENEAILAVLRELGVTRPWHDSNRETTPELFGGVRVEDVAVYLGFDKSLDSACFQISTPASLAMASTPARGSRSNESLTRQQEDAAINFILSLEHVCWDHFALGDFTRHAQPPHTDDDGEKEHGHHLMATALCMEDAPAEVYSSRAAFPPSRCPLLPPLLRPQALPSPPPEFRWEASSISLSHLRGLAASLNPGLEELAPVQAWFELAERYSPVVLVESGLLQALQLELKGVVRCVGFGAAMERTAFESVVGRVMQPYT